jgi:pimeloyl-ACP methyl ester carboxylesterase
LFVHRPGHRTRAAAAMVAVIATVLTACTSKASPPAPVTDPTPAASSTAAPQSDVASPASSSASTPATASTPVTAPATTAGGTDGRSDPGAYATDLQWTDVTKKLRAAVNDKKQFLYATGTMQVPLNWADANGKKITLTLLRIRSTTQKNRIGSLLINPGGPGVSGVNSALEIAIEELPAAILQRFDIVGFDPRGIGLSDPLKCIPDKQKDAELNEPADPTTDAAWQAEISETTLIAKECYTAYGSDLTYFSTTETVRDMEALRAKLGDAKLTYLGYSYGTLIGAEYASAYPTKVRALVLDGAVDPTLTATDEDKSQADGFQLAFSHYAASCRAQDSGCGLGTDPQAFVLRLMAKAAANPIASGDKNDKRKAADGAVLLAVISALYDASDWDTLTTALVDADHGDASGILSLDDQYNERADDGSYSNVEDANATIGCADASQRPTFAQARALEPVWRASNPLFGGSAASGLGFCSVWQAPPDHEITVADNNAAPVVVIGNTGDPATPIAGARHLAELLGTARLLVWDGDGDTAYPKTGCITNAVDTYLIDLTLPATGTICPAG